MSRSDVETEIRETLGMVPSFWSQVPDFLMESEWQSFKAIELAETAIPNKYKELIGLSRVRRHAVPVLRLLPRRGGAPVRRHRGGDRRGRR